MRPEKNNPTTYFLSATAWALLLFLPFLSSCRSSSSESASGPVTITYWEKWTGHEGTAIKKVVDTFNAKQDKIYVKILTISEIERKLMIAISGGDPPDVSGLYSHSVFVFADLGTLMPLDDLMQECQANPDTLIPLYLKECRYRNRYYGLPIAGMTLALHYNRQHFREVGLDPDRPPRTIKELEDYSRKLTKRKKDGSFERIGFLPVEPGWWNWSWVYYFGGSLYDEAKHVITSDSPENLKAMQWFSDFSKEYGVNDILNFRSGFGNFSSPQSPFLDGKLSMCIQGVWMYSYIQNFNSKLDWGVAPFPAFSDKLHDVTLIESDALVIPNGSRHPKEAMEFIAYVVSQEGQEQLSLGQMKFPMTRKVSDEFWKKNVNPHLKVYRALADSPCAFTAPRIGIFQEFYDEAYMAFDQVWLLKMEPQEALAAMQKRIEKKYDRELRQLRRRGLEPD